MTSTESAVSGRGFRTIETCCHPAAGLLICAEWLDGFIVGAHRITGPAQLSQGALNSARERVQHKEGV